jgi:peptide/nickel transport system substrate-binding protein
MILAMGLVASACSGAVPGASVPPASVPPASVPPASEAPASEAPASEAPASEAPASEAAAVTRPIVIQTGEENLGSLDPAENFGTAAPMFLAHLYDRLFQVTGEPETLQPMLATEIPTTENGGISADGLVYTIKLRSDAKFHDGTAVDASAVVYSFERAKEFEAGASVVSANRISSGEAVDPQTVRFTLVEPFGDFLLALASGWGSYILNPAAIEANTAAGDLAPGDAWLQEHDAGSGPYTLTSVDVAAKQITIDRFDGWWGWTDGPHIEKAIIRYGVESATSRQTLERGEADIVTGPTADDFNQLKTAPGIVALNFTSLQQLYISLLNSVEPFNDVKVRQALQYTIDRETLNEGVFGGYLGKMVGVISDGFPEAANPPTTTYPFDLAKAEQLLAEAGYTASNPLRFSIVPLGFWEGDAEVVQIWQSDLAKIGVELDILQVDPALFDTAWYECNATTVPGSPKGASGSYTADWLSAWSLLWSVYSRDFGGCGNTFYGENEQATQLFDQYAKETDAETRKELMQQLNEILTVDAQTVWIGGRPNLIAMRDVVKGYSYTDLHFNAYVPLAAMWLER